ncbi:MAG: 1-(5-phosphoribosyl)-5-[(5-phosphoribosylamino)methylideneamino]imidazole-4-carboxamide isomerase [Planctomycetaceae bacterium]|jgi:phosphoribosylformimino-5-aminoimidazole carboxamide ribotide isomerase|nr:1-(5-phosphoribosyl)-5-[(5-phosphoribosylamino)methylideneamino]imidazole-4-carboxamide isomerase [Planctomycetaceae bacterium]
MEIWPAIDIRQGKCVRLRQGDYSQETVFSESPAETAQYWASQGAKRLHLVDLDGAKDGKPTNLESIRKLVRTVDVPCELGGGIRDEQTIQLFLNEGIARLVVGTLALKQPDWFRKMCDKYPEKLVLGIDAKGGRVATDGWLETSETSAAELAKQFEELPIAAIVYTDVATDGMMQGPNLAEMQTMQQHVRVPVIASGGVTTFDDIQRLDDAKLAGCIIGRALYEKTILLSEVMKCFEPR